MPTGYTADVVDGKITELEPFVWQLARGLGALITMRDEPWDAPIPERFEPSTKYHDEQLAEARAERDRLYALAETEAQAAADAEFAEWKADKARQEAEHTERRNRYSAMIAKVVQWEGAPEGIKEFALEQLRSGRDFDCREPFQYYSPEPQRHGAKWRDEKLARAAKDITYHETKRAEEIARTEGRNAWLAQLRRSLAAQGTSAGTAKVRLTAKAVVRNNAGDEAEITPEAMDFSSVGDAISAFAEWAKGGFWPAARPIHSVTATIRALKAGAPAPSDADQTDRSEQGEAK